jgi:hypothetical protein
MAASLVVGEEIAFVKSAWLTSGDRTGREKADLFPVGGDPKVGD